MRERIARSREIPAFALDVRCRKQRRSPSSNAASEPTASSPAARARDGQPDGVHESRLRARLRELGIAHRRGGYRDPESQAFIESWFSKLKERLVWREEFETLDQARAAIGAYVERYHHRPHQFLGYRTPKEVRRTWEDARGAEALRNQAA